MFETAQKLFEAGLKAQAAFFCRKQLALNPGDPPTLHLLGVLEQQNGNYSEAARHFLRLIEGEPGNPCAWSNYGVACLALGNREQAQKSFEEAVRLAPDYAEAWNNLGIVHEKQSVNKAEECFKRAIELNSAIVDPRNNLARVFKKLQRYNEAIECYRISLSVKQEQPEVLERLAELLEQASDLEGARSTYAKSLALRADDSLRVKMETVLPVIIESTESIECTRASLWKSIKTLEGLPLHIDRTGDNARTLFFLAYHGMNDREFHEAMCRIYRAAAPTLTWEAPHLALKEVPDDGRIRVGFISRFFYNHTIAKLNIGYIEKIDRSRFHVTVLVIATGVTDAMLRRFEAAADSFVLLTGDLAQMRQQAADQKLDILMYTDIGMEPFSYFLAFSRLARVQCLTWGHPATSGIDTIDYFISHEDCETEPSRSAYTERLFCLSSAATCTCYAMPALENSGRTPDSFGIPHGRTIYYCPQTPFKMHPDFDVILGEILNRDPNGLVVLLRGVMPQTETLLRDRFAKTISAVIDRIQFIDPLPFPDYMSMMEQADVVLDTPHFSGGNSSVEGFAVGAPIVTLPTAYLKGRLTYSWYRTLGIDDCIAWTPEEYVAIAVDLGTHPEKRTNLRKRIREASPRLFDNLQAVRELEQFFERVHNP